MIWTILLLALLNGCAGEPAPPPPSTSAPVQETKAVVEQQTPSIETMLASFTKYEIAVVRKGPKWTNDAPEKIAKMAAQKGDYWKSLIDEGKLLGLVQPTKPADIWGLLFFKVREKEEMQKIAADAPAVKAGLLAVDIRTVWGSRGLGAGLKETVKNMKMDGKGETYYLVTLVKGPKWSDKADAPETRKASGEGMMHLYDLYKAGSLRFFAAFEDMSLKLRNIVIMKVPSAEEAMKLMKTNPAVKQGSHVPAVYEVKIPEGIVP